MVDLHPFFVHFPIALIVVAFLFDVYAAIISDSQYHKSAFILQLGSALAALPAAFSGNLAETAVRANGVLSGVVAESLDRHTSMANILVWLIIIFALSRVYAVLERKHWALAGWVYPGIGLFMAGFTILTGLAGGTLSSDILSFFINN